MSQKYVIVSFLDGNTVPTEFSYREWPLHITLLANFTLPDPTDQLLEELAKYARSSQPFKVMTDGEALFGPGKNIAVSLVQTSDTIRMLHDDLIAISSTLGAVYDEPMYMGDGFKPHVTKRPGVKLQDKATITVNSLSLVDMFPNNNIERRRIVETFGLGGNTKPQPIHR